MNEGKREKYEGRIGERKRKFMNEGKKRNVREG